VWCGVVWCGVVSSKSSKFRATNIFNRATHQQQKDENVRRKLKKKQR
jgi:hypothetical protein